MFFTFALLAAGDYSPSVKVPDQCWVDSSDLDVCISSLDDAYYDLYGQRPYEGPEEHAVWMAAVNPYVKRWQELVNVRKAAV